MASGKYSKNKQKDREEEQEMKKGSTFNILKKASSSNKVEITGDLLKQVQGTLLQMLKDFAAVCDRNGFYYSLCGGSALGAVRHQGFIPWDDDVDVFMLRKDYNKFLEIFDKELGDKYIINAPSINPEIGVPVTQIMKKDTIFRTYNNPTGDRCGIYIDLFVLENAPDNAILRKLHGLGSLFWGYGLSCSRFNRMRDDLLKVYADAGDEVTNAIKSKARKGAFFKFLSVATWNKRYDKWNSMCHNDDSKYVVCVVGLKHYFKEIFPRDIYGVTAKLKFEDTEFNVIKDYDWALTRLYGDYMKVPPPEKQEKHFAIEVKL